VPLFPQAVTAIAGVLDHAVGHCVDLRAMIARAKAAL
jgi:hypothetical protein